MTYKIVKTSVETEVVLISSEPLALVDVERRVRNHTVVRSRYGGYYRYAAELVGSGLSGEGKPWFWYNVEITL